MPLSPEIQQSLDKLVAEIVRLVNPEEIILFGSAARPEVTQPNDLDLLVVMPEGVQKVRVMKYLYKKIDDVLIPFDILVATKQELKKHAHNIGLIYHYILNEGVRIYVD